MADHIRVLVHLLLRRPELLLRSCQRALSFFHTLHEVVQHFAHVIHLAHVALEPFAAGLARVHPLHEPEQIFQ